jgi:hypothetical protein
MKRGNEKGVIYLLTSYKLDQTKLMDSINQSKPTPFQNLMHSAKRFVDVLRLSNVCAGKVWGVFDCVTAPL